MSTPHIHFMKGDIFARATTYGDEIGQISTSLYFCAKYIDISEFARRARMTNADHLIWFAFTAERRAHHFTCIDIADHREGTPEGG